MIEMINGGRVEDVFTGSREPIEFSIMDANMGPHNPTTLAIQCVVKQREARG